MNVTVTEDCIACERCVEICPDVFEMGDEFAEVIVDTVPPEYEDAVEEAAEECPADAIIVEG
ncbi:MAG: ferredoxin [Planctomycetes bacterium]|nr:ferredoxin [Planctomycetota bacterium]